MVDLRILWINKDEEYRIFTQELTLRRALGNLGVEVIYHELTPQTADITELDRTYQPDVINIINSSWLKNVGNRKAVATVLTGDPHGHNCITFINENKIEASLHPVRGVLPEGKFTYGMENVYREKVYEGHKLIFFPWWVDDEMFKPLEKDIDVFFAGEFKSYYPLRARIWYDFLTRPEYQKDFKIVYRPRPRRTRSVARDAPRWFIREDYAEMIGRSRMFPFGSGKFKYPLRKYPEVMACETLVLSDLPADSAELGFIPDVNLVEIDGQNFIEKLYYYRDNPDEREKIAKRGRELIVKKHSAKVRARQYLEIIEGLLHEQ